MKVINFFKSLFSKNPGWKLASLALAVILWFVVMNLINPAETKSFSVPITIANEEELAKSGYSLLNKKDLAETKIDVKVKGTRPALDELTRQKDMGALTADIDLKNFDTSRIVNTPQGLVLNINPHINDIYIYTYEITSFSPSNVNVVFDSVSQKEMEIETELTGSLPEGYKAEIVKMAAENVQVIGPSSEAANIGSVYADINVEGKTSGFQIDVKPVVRDYNGEEMSNFYTDPPIISMKVDVAFSKSIEVLQPNKKGKLNGDLVFKGVDWTPKYIEVSGTKEDVQGISPIVLPEIKLDDLVGSDVRIYEISDYIDTEKVNIKEGTPRVITVTIDVTGKDGKNITIKADEIKVNGLASGLRAQLPSQVVFTLFGDPAALANASAKTLSPSIDLTGITEGATEVPLKLSLPTGLEMRGETKVYAYVSKAEETTVTTTTETTTEAVHDQATTTTEAPKIVEPEPEETTEEEEKDENNEPAAEES